jgi:hypothetical protein|tara:strand:+ start:1882 stop:2049 length:168 start_codon:yes stop_codon:yes gene_type:complete
MLILDGPSISAAEKVLVFNKRLSNREPILSIRVKIEFWSIFADEYQTKVCWEYGT